MANAFLRAWLRRVTGIEEVRWLTVEQARNAITGLERIVQEVNPEALKAAIEDTGYHYISISSEPYEKKGLFGK